MTRLPNSTSPEIEALALAVAQGYDQRAWHGPNLRSALRGVAAAMAAWRPGDGRPSIWELAVHAAYWKYRVLRKLDDDAPQSFDEPGSNFFARPPQGAEVANLDGAWRRDLERLGAWHEQLLGAVRRFDPSRLDEISYDGYSHRDVILGAAAHDVYHAGQIRLLRKLFEEQRL